MAKIISLSPRNAGILRRAASILSFLVILAVIVFLLVGFVPFQDREMTVFIAIDNVLDFVDFFKFGSLQCLLGVIFSIWYIVFIIKLIKTLIEHLISIKAWLFTKKTNNDTRSATRLILDSSNSVLLNFVVIFTSSYMFDNFRVSPIVILTFAILIFIIVIANAMSVLVFKGSVHDAVFTSINKGLVLFCVAGYLFVDFDMEVPTLLRNLRSIFINGDIWSETPGFILDAICRDLVIPFAFLLTFLFSKSIFGAIIDSDYGWDNRHHIASSKGLFTRNVILMACLLVLFGFSREYYQLSSYFGLLLTYFPLVAIPAAIWVCSKNVNVTTSDIKLNSFNELKE